MADVTISQLPNKTTANSTDVLPITDGITTSKISVSNLLGGSLPLGFIGMWSGSTIPSGWALCNGQTVNGITTPNLTDRFIVGSGSSYTTGNIGGAESVTLTVNQIPSHSHAVIANGASGFGSNHNWIGGNNGWPYNPGWNTSSTGGGQAHENRPPYYALAFIMKVS